MNKFYKVSKEQFKKDCLNLGYTDEKEIDEAYENIVLPKRSTAFAAGYDIISPFEVTLNKEHPVCVIPTGIRIQLDEDKVFILAPRSGLGFKTGMRLSNTIGIIDADYFNANNEGHMMASITYGFKDLTIKKGDRFMQGMILPYFIVCDDNSKEVRTGGFGSTGSK